MKQALIFILLAFLVSGCGQSSGPPSPPAPYVYKEESSSTVPLTAQTRLLIRNTNGRITITGSDASADLVCSITREVDSKISDSDAESHLPDITVSSETGADSVRYEVHHPSSEDRSYQVLFDIVLPNDFNYDLTLTNIELAGK